MSQQRLAEIKLASARAQLASRYGAKDDGVTDCTGAFLAVFDVAFLLARIEELEKVASAARRVCGNRKWTSGLDELRAALAALGGEDG